MQDNKRTCVFITFLLNTKMKSLARPSMMILWCIANLITFYQKEEYK